MSASNQRPAPREERGSHSAPDDMPTVTDATTARTFFAKRTVNDAAYVRLRTELAAAIPEFELLVERSSAEGESWVTRGREFLRMAVTNLRRGDFDESWRHLHTARRLEVYGLERLEERARDDESTSDATGERVKPRSELQVRAAVVYEQALDNLSGWRRRAVINLLGDDSDELDERVTGAELRAAKRILDEHFESVYLVRSEHQRQFNQLVSMGVLSGLSLFVLSLIDWILGDATTGFAGIVATFLETPFGTTAPEVTAPGFAVFVTVAGVMGASLFGMRSLRKRSGPTKIPQQINQLTVTSARAVIGAISALLFYFVLQTPLLGSGTIVVDNIALAPTMVVVGFAAGYNERMAPAVVARVASLTDTDDPEETESSE